MYGTERAEAQTGGDLDGERDRCEVESKSVEEEEAYGIDTIHGGSNDSQYNNENRDGASVLSCTECMHNIQLFDKSYNRTEVKQVGRGWWRSGVTTQEAKHPPQYTQKSHPLVLLQPDLNILSSGQTQQLSSPHT